jgi:hypothetical protein
MATTRPCTSPCPPPIWASVLANEFCRIFSISRFIFACTLSGAFASGYIGPGPGRLGARVFGGSKQDASGGKLPPLNDALGANLLVFPGTVLACVELDFLHGSFSPTEPILKISEGLEFFTVADPGSRWGSDCKSIRILLAERVGFEPTLEFPLNTLSKRAPSATRPSLRRRLGLSHYTG